MKPLVWLGSSRADVGKFPLDARRVTGFQLWRLQLGLDPNDWRPMPSVGSGVRDLATARERLRLLVERKRRNG